MKTNTNSEKILKYFALIFLTLNLTSCFYGYGDDDDPAIAGRNNTYKGSVIDTDGNPISGKTIVLKSSYDQHIAEFITDENGLFEGQGDIYNTGLQVGVKNEENNFPNVHNNFIQYTFDYTEFPSGEIIEFPPLIYAPISFFKIEITNNTGANYVAEYQFLIGGCTKSFQNNIETYSFCYEEDTRYFNLASSGTTSRGVFALTGSTIVVTLTNDISTITETYIIDEIDQQETIIFE